MCGSALWDLGMLEVIFAEKVACLPPPLVGRGPYSKLAWIEKYNGRAFISVDMREANFSALRVMALLVDTSLDKKLQQGWLHFLDSTLGSKAILLRGTKVAREIVLGGLERAWLRRQPDMRKIKGIDTTLQELDGKSFLDRAFMTKKARTIQPNK